MNKFVCFINIFSLMLLKASVNALECQHGGRIEQNGNVVNTFFKAECPDPSFVCGRFDVTGTLQGESSKKIKFMVMQNNDEFFKNS